DLRADGRGQHRADDRAPLPRARSVADPAPVSGGHEGCVTTVSGVLRRTAGRPAPLSAAVRQSDDAGPAPQVYDHAGRARGMARLLRARAGPRAGALSVSRGAPTRVSSIPEGLLAVDGEHRPGRRRIVMRLAVVAAIGSYSAADIEKKTRH